MFNIELVPYRMRNSGVCWPLDKALLEKYIQDIDKDLEREYLKRKKLDVVYRISKDEIYICTESTSYIREVRQSKLVQAELLDMYKNILRNCKEKGVKIRYKNGLKKNILSLWPEYEKEHKEYTVIFDELVERVKKLEERGIRMGSADDEYLSICHSLNHLLNPYTYRNSTSGTMKSIYYELREMERIANSSEFSQYTYIVL